MLFSFFSQIINYCNYIMFQTSKIYFLVSFCNARDEIEIGAFAKQIINYFSCFWVDFDTACIAEVGDIQEQFLWHICIDKCFSNTRIVVNHHVALIS